MITSALIAHQFTNESKEEAIYHSLAHTQDLSPQCWVNKRLNYWEERIPSLHQQLALHLSHCNIIHLQSIPYNILPRLYKLEQVIILNYSPAAEARAQSKNKLIRLFQHYCVKRIPQLALVASSKEATSKLATHPLFQGRSKYHIPQPINCQQFYPRPRIICKDSLSIPPQMQVIAFRCDHTKRELANETIQSVCQQLKQLGILGLHIILLGKIKAPSLPYPCTCIYMEEQTAYARSRIYNAVNILIHLSSKGENETQLLEGMACGLPIIASRISGTQEHITNNLSGYILEDNSSSAIVHHLLILLRAPVLREHYGLHSLRHIKEHHEEEHVGKLYKKLYEEQLAARHARHATNQAVLATA